MIAKNCTIHDLHQALDAINIRYVGNIEFRHIEPKGKRITFTLRTKSSKGPGHRRGYMGKRLPYACWHVHGHFFEELFRIQPSAGIFSSGSLANPVTGKWITKNGGNWQDRDLGSCAYPLMHSEACDCGPLKPVSESAGVKTFQMSYEMIKKCPEYIMVPEHYRQDGTCLCFDIDEQARKRLEKINRRTKINQILERQKREEIQYDGNT